MAISPNEILPMAQGQVIARVLNRTATSVPHSAAKHVKQRGGLKTAFTDSVTIKAIQKKFTYGFMIRNIPVPRTSGDTATLKVPITSPDRVARGNANNRQSALATKGNK